MSPRNDPSDLDGYRLQPVAYNPLSRNAEKPEGEEETRQSWQQGDDVESVTPPSQPPSQPPPKPPKVRRDRGDSESQRAAPQLPPLFFESDSRVEQHDFAYGSPGRNQQKTGVTTSQSPFKSVSHVQRPSQGHIQPFPSAPLGPPPPRPQYNGPKTADGHFRKDSKAQASHDIPNDQPWQSSQSLPLIQPKSDISTTSQQSRSSPSALTHTSPNPAGQIPSKSNSPPGRPSTTKLSGREHPGNIVIPDTTLEPPPEDGQDTNSSFYWHSPQSSTDTTLDRTPTSSAVEETTIPPSTKKSTATTDDAGLYSASVLGFGGPSDWEHFTDSNAELIDDLEIYASPKPRQGSKIGPYVPADRAELPEAKSPPEEPAKTLTETLSAIPEQAQKTSSSSNEVQEESKEIKEAPSAQPLYGSGPEPSGQIKETPCAQSLRSFVPEQAKQIKETPSTYSLRNVVPEHPKQIKETPSTPSLRTFIGQQVRQVKEAPSAQSLRSFVPEHLLVTEPQKVTNVEVAIPVSVPIQAPAPYKEQLAPLKTDIKTGPIRKDRSPIQKIASPLGTIKDRVKQVQIPARKRPVAKPKASPPHQVQAEQPRPEPTPPAQVEVEEKRHLRPEPEPEIKPKQPEVKSESESKSLDQSQPKVEPNHEFKAPIEPESECKDGIRPAVEPEPEPEPQPVAEGVKVESENGQPGDQVVTETRQSPAAAQETAFGEDKRTPEILPERGNEVRGPDLPAEDVKDDLEQQFTLASPMSGRSMFDPNAEEVIISFQVPDPSLEHQNGLKQPENQPTSAVGPTASLQPNGLQSSLHGLENGASQRHSIFPKSLEMEDPYANLDLWAKASLNRYVKMLHEEAAAKTNEQKYMIFMQFTKRESRLRAVLYDVDDEPEPVGPPVKRAALKGSTSILTLRPSLKSKALPALPTDAMRNNHRDIKSATEGPSAAARFREKTRGGSVNSIDGFGGKHSGGLLSTDGIIMEHVVDDYIDSPTEQYTPGGRPVISRLMNDPKPSPLKVTPSLTSLRRALDVVATQANAVFGKDGRESGSDLSILEMGKAPVDTDAPRPNSLPPQSSDGTVKEGGATSLEKPAYTPFKYSEGQPYEGDKATNRQSIYRPFSMSLRPGSIGSGTEEAKELINRTEDVPPVPSIKHEYRKSEDSSKIAVAIEPEKRPPMPALSPALEKNVVAPLLRVIPRGEVLHPEPQQIVHLRQAMDAIPEDFSFIEKIVVAWDAEARRIREQHDAERQIRQGETEQHIDFLFNENEIGYSDISNLEAEFKRSEAAKKADEDRAEYNSFVTHVFDVVWGRLHYEMDQLAPLYEYCIRLTNEASVGRNIFENPVQRVPMHFAMDTLLVLHQRLGIRHHKAFEAVFERDRRLKKTDVARWYALGDSQKVKKTEKRFEESEKDNILNFCREQDHRANQLMDVLDQNTLRGVGANQDYMESVMQAVRKIALDVALGVIPEDTPISTDEVLKAKTVTTALARSSEQIVQTFHVADMLLNAADYEVSVANARKANAKPESYKHLRTAKAQEDQKLVKDLEHRMTLIRGDTSRTLDEITKLLSLVKNDPGTPSRPTSAPADPEKEARMQAALEEAKRRNAQRAGEGSGLPP